MLILGYGKTGDGMLRHNDGVPPAPTPYVHLWRCVPSWQCSENPAGV